MTVRLKYNDFVVDKDDNICQYDGNLIEQCISRFGLDFSFYRLSDMKQSFDTKTIDFFLKEEDYIKLRNNKINKILSE
jgi:hypothetical protein